MFNYERAKRMNFLLAVIYGSHRQHSNSCKTLDKNRKILKSILMTILGLAHDEPARPDRDAL